MTFLPMTVPPGLQHAGHDRGVEVRHEPVERERAEAHRHAGDGDVVLVADRLAGQQALRARPRCCTTTSRR